MLTIDLGGKWALKALTQGESSMLSISRLPRDGWIEATVPGVVHLELMSAGRIPDPFYRMNETKVAWVEDFEWIYMREFEVDDRIVNRDAAELVFDGLDTFATVWLNGEKVGEPRDMFVEHRFDIKGVLRTGSNKLVVWFESPKRFLERERAKAAVKLNGGSYSPLVYGRKASYYYVKRAFAPIVVILAKDDDTIKAWVVNDELRELSGELTLRGLTLDGKSLKLRPCKVVVKPNSSAEVAQATLEDLGVSDGTRQVVVAELVVDGQAIAHATCLLKEPKHLEFPKPRPKTRLRQADRSGTLFEVSILSRVFIKSANLDFKGSDAEYEDNYFDVLPGVPKVLTIKTGRRFKPTNLKKRLRLRDVTSYSCVQQRRRHK